MSEARLTQWSRQTGRPVASRGDFAAMVASALESRRGFATGKLGVTERALLAHRQLLESEGDRRRLLAFEQSLAFKAGRQAGLFPSDPAFLRQFSAFYAEQVRQLDCIGLMSQSLSMVESILEFLRLDPRLVYYKAQQPDRSQPARPELCYLPHLCDRRLLLISPFAELLRARANRETFEAVWARIRKPWFHPAAVEAFAVPYGFVPEVQRRHGTSLQLLEELTRRLDEVEFDLALIGAGGLGIPLAAACRRRGKVGISLGGHLQVLFGVLGDRWKTESWRRRYVNEAWIDMPDQYRPDPRHTSENYW